MISAGCIALRVLSLWAVGFGRSIFGSDTLAGIGKAPAESEGRRVEVGARASREAGATIVGCIDGAAVRAAARALPGDIRRCGLSVGCFLFGLPSAESSRSRGNMGWTTGLAGDREGEARFMVLTLADVDLVGIPSDLVLGRRSGGKIFPIPIILLFYQF